MTVVMPPVTPPLAFFTTLFLTMPRRAGKFVFVAASQTSGNAFPPVVHLGKAVLWRSNGRGIHFPCTRPCRFWGRRTLVPGRGPVFARLRAAQEHAGTRVDENGLVAAAIRGLANDLVAAAL